MSAFVDIQNALAAALSAAPALADGRISLNSLRPVPDGKASAIVVRLDRSDSAENPLRVLNWASSYAVECYARAATGADPAAAVDTLLSDVWTRLCALDLNPHGASLAMRPGIDWQYDEAATPMVCAVLRITVLHQTFATTLQART